MLSISARKPTNTDKATGIKQYLCHGSMWLIYMVIDVFTRVWWSLTVNF
jgi:hypothetical protein